jgi:hypothetical protein
MCVVNVYRVRGKGSEVFRFEYVHSNKYTTGMALMKAKHLYEKDQVPYYRSGMHHIHVLLLYMCTGAPVPRGQEVEI